MIATHALSTPLEPGQVRALRAGHVVYLTGTLLAGREDAHQRLTAQLDAGEAPPVDLRGAVIYYTGPSPLTPLRPIGSAGPSSAWRMDPFTPPLHRAGLAGSIGKGQRGPEVAQALREHGAVYFGATGGAGALLSLCVRRVRPVAYPDLGPEALFELVVDKFPLVVLCDSLGNSHHAAPDLERALRG